MKKIILAGILFLALFGTNTTHAQTLFEVPEDGVLVTKDDYIKYESTIIEAAKWLEETNLDKEVDKRLLIIDFVLRWLTGSDAVTVEVTEAIAKVYGENDPLLGIFLASYARNTLENKGAPSKFNDTKAAVLSMVKVYKKGISITKSKQMERVIKAVNENNLDVYITEVLHVPKD